MIKFTVCLLLLFFTLSASGQRTMLMLDKEDSRKDAYYEVDDELTFYLEGRKSRISNTILGFKDSTIVFRNYEVPISQITALHIDNKTRWWLRYKPAQLLLIAGTGYLLIDIFNSQEINKETLVISGSLIGLGLIFRLLIPNRIRIRGKTKLRIVEV